MQSIESWVNAPLKALEPYRTGKPIEETARELGLDPKTIVKLASNENPLGPSPRAVEAIRAAADRVHVYPDGGAFYLRQGIADRFGVDLGNVVLGNGSNEIIELLGHAFLNDRAEVIMADHAFVVYKLMAQLFGARCVEVPDPNFVHDLDAMRSAVTERTRLIFVANPNNPTGTRVANEALDRFIEGLPEHVVAVLDEAYYEFLADPPDTLRFVREGRKVVVMRTFSKSQGLAGLRIGYGFAPVEIAGWLQRARQPFNANALAQAAALASLNDEEHQNRTRTVVDEGRVQLRDAFASKGLEQVASSANFVLVKVGRGREVFEALLKRGVIVRAMDEYKLPEWIRVSIGTQAQNDKFLSALSEIV